MEENQQIEFEVTKKPTEEKLLGIGGWLVLVQVAMAVAVLVPLVGLESNIEDGSALRIAVLGVQIALMVVSIVQFYRYRMMFRISFLCYVVVAMVYFYSLSKYAIVGSGDFAIVSICFAVMVALVVFLFSSSRVKNTFCEQGRHELIAIKRADPPRGIDGWLILIQLRIVEAIAGTFVDIAPTIGAAGYYNLMEIVVTISLVVVATICAVQFYCKKMAFRILYIITMAISYISTIINMEQNMQNVYEWIALIPGIIINVLLIVALFKSERVKNTFS